MSTVYLPDDVSGRLPVIFAYPGAGYSRKYYDISAQPGYSQARFHTDRGAILVACDHLYVGDSDVPDPFTSSYESVAAANHATAVALLEQLRLGHLLSVDGDETIGPVEMSKVVGIGQSMGGCFLTVQQGRHHTFDGVGLLGWSGVHTNFPSPDGDRMSPEVPERGTDLRPLADDLAQLGGEVLQYYAFSFHWDQSEELVQSDLAAYDQESGLVRGDSRCPWGSATVPACANTMVSPGTVAGEAALIRVPVISVSGVRDFIPDPWAEAAAYRGSPDVTIAVFPRMAHMHNFAVTRALLWERLESWIAGVKGRTAAVEEV